MGKKRITLSLGEDAIDMASRLRRRHGLRSLSATVNALLLHSLRKLSDAGGEEPTAEEEIRAMFGEYGDYESIDNGR